MGQEMSNQVDASVAPQTLEARSLDAVARLIQDGKAKRIVVLAGAGISTAAGIPDFRSPDTGLYANLERLHLPYAEAVFSIDFFRQDPQPFYVLARDLYPGQFHPTVSHAFLALLARKGLLELLFTQNIDCLERAAGVPADRIVEAHGSFASQRCIDCKAPFADDAAMRAHVRAARVPRCPQPGCGGLVKPDIVFFGESLPPRFHALRDVPATAADLVLILGTSLSVYPFAGLATMAAAGVPRVLFNREPVGDIGTRADDVLALGSCDAGVRRLADALGWRAELEALWRGIVGDKEADRQLQQGPLLVRPASPPSDDESEDGKGDQAEIQADDKDDGAEVKSDSKDEATAEADSKDKAPQHKPISSAEAEVGSLAAKIEAVLQLEEKAAEEQPLPKQDTSPKPSPEPQPRKSGDGKQEAMPEATAVERGSDPKPPKLDDT